MLEMSEKLSNTLPYKHISQALDKARSDILEGLSDDQAGLRCRWDRVNKTMLGGWRFDNVYMLAGASGSGKSFILNMLHQDFCNSDLNSNFKKPFLILHFCFEMSASDEVLRTLSTLTKKSYAELLSAHKKLEDYEQVIKNLDVLRDRQIYYVETSGNLGQMYNTIKQFKEKFPNHELVVTHDHTLLTEYTNEKTEIDLLAKSARLYIDIRKEFKALIIPVSQLNDKIEDPKRIANKALHFPTKTDVHGSKQMYWACDYVWVIHRPESLNIEKYGRMNYMTNGLIAMHLIKSRKGVPGLVRLREKLSEGQIIQWED
jgi:replicative DNA helicase